MSLVLDSQRKRRGIWDEPSSRVPAEYVKLVQAVEDDADRYGQLVQARRFDDANSLREDMTQLLAERIPGRPSGLSQEWLAAWFYWRVTPVALSQVGVPEDLLKAIARQRIMVRLRCAGCHEWRLPRYRSQVAQVESGTRPFLCEICSIRGRS